MLSKASADSDINHVQKIQTIKITSSFDCWWRWHDNQCSLESIKICLKGKGTMVNPP